MLKKGIPLKLLIIICFVFTGKTQQLQSHSFFFVTDSSKLNVTELQSFKKVVKGLDTLNINSITILGYCDDVGRKGYNDTLSQKRANYIKNLFVEGKLQNKAIKIIEGKGKISLASKKNIQNQRSFNRRVDVIISYSTKNTIIEKGLLSDTLKVGDKIILENILFETSRHQLLPESYPTLIKLTKVLKEKTQYNIAILGHICCNPPGKDIRDFDTGEYNLSLARARIIYDYLVQNGINPKRLTYKGMMANYPLGKGDKNDRRVELQITSINP